MSSVSEQHRTQMEADGGWLWHRCLFFGGMHLGAGYGLWLLLTVARWSTCAWCVLLFVVSGLSITAGAHRLWSHRSYQAHAALRFALMLANCVALQSDIISWSITHRCHHRWSDTPADPHNACRGFWYSHMGWILRDKSRLRALREAQVNADDLHAERILVVQRRYYGLLSLLCCFLLPTYLAVAIGGETRSTAFFVCVCFRYMWLQHATWTVNSLAHIWGLRPYNQRIRPAQNMASVCCTLGEGWHNYHHVFPSDYRASEWGRYVNLTTAFIDACQVLGCQDVADKLVFN